MRLSIEVENIKCGGCANSIRKKVSQHPAVLDVNVDINQGIVEITSQAKTEKAQLKTEMSQLLASLGYPEKGSVEGVAALKGKAKSYVSCAIGRIGDNQ